MTEQERLKLLQEMQAAQAAKPTNMYGAKLRAAQGPEHDALENKFEMEEEARRKKAGIALNQDGSLNLEQQKARSLFDDMKNIFAPSADRRPMEVEEEVVDQLGNVIKVKKKIQ